LLAALRQQTLAPPPITYSRMLVNGNPNLGYDLGTITSLGLVAVAGGYSRVCLVKGGQCTGRSTVALEAL